ncbi:MAG: hypothetical protein K6E52_11210 [Bacteroidaceae bacterium]|jgi:hypothetical protein|nr:hypothetical protein [Bacteroidaceae bacterium]
MKKSIWLPILLFCAGAAVYIYSGIDYNAWKENLPLIIADLAIVVLLHFMLKKKEAYEDERKGKS